MRVFPDDAGFCPADGSALQFASMVPVANTSDDKRVGTKIGGRYEIRVRGRLQDRWTVWFDGLSITDESDGTTVLRGDLVDQAALDAALRKLADLGLPLLSVTNVPI